LQRDHPAPLGTRVKCLSTCTVIQTAEIGAKPFLPLVIVGGPNIHAFAARPTTCPEMPAMRTLPMRRPKNPDQPYTGRKPSQYGELTNLRGTGRETTGSNPNTHEKPRGRESAQTAELARASKKWPPSKKRHAAPSARRDSSPFFPGPIFAARRTVTAPTNSSRARWSFQA